MTLIHRIAGRIVQNMIYLKICEVCFSKISCRGIANGISYTTTVYVVPSGNEYKYSAVTCVRESSVKYFEGTHVASSESTFGTANLIPQLWAEENIAPNYSLCSKS